MPLPINTSLSLLGPSRLGDALPAKPKKAMVVRLTPETLDALEASNQPQVQFEFGENPGVYIGQSYFPMAHIQDNSIQELYLRAPSASKRNAPLKLYANIVGKFTVEKREIGDDLRDKIRESTQDAAAQKSSRGTVFIPTPPEQQAVVKKRKEPPSSNMFRKPLRPTDKVKATPPSSTPPPAQKLPVPVPSATAQPSGVPIRRRLIQCLARGEKSEEELFKLLGAADRSSNLRSDILELLDQLAESRTEKSHKFYLLKSLAWKEVRPFEYPGLSESERAQMARSGVVALKTLRIPESDPLWEHFQSKISTTSTLASSSQSYTSSDSHRISSAPMTESRSGIQDAPKRGISSREIKEKKAKQRPDPVADIQMRDESQRASSSRSRPDSSMEVRRTSDTVREPSSVKRQLPPSTKPRPSERDTLERSVSADNNPLPRRMEKEHSTSTSHTKPSAPKEGHTQTTKVRRSIDVRPSDSERGTPGPSTDRVRAKERAIKRELQEDDYLETKSKSMKRREAKEQSVERVRRKGDDFDDLAEKPIKRKVKREEDQGDLRMSTKRRPMENLGDPRLASKARPAEENYSDPRKRRGLDDDHIPQKFSSSKHRARDNDEDDDKSRTMLRQRSWEESSNSIKRKSVDQEDDYYESNRPKKRKVDRESVSSSLSTAQRERGNKEHLPVKKTSTDRMESDTKARVDSGHHTLSHSRRDSPPANRPSASQDSTERRAFKVENALPSITKSSKASSTTKLRRRSPVYTSSDDDEKDDDLPLSKRLSVKNSLPDPPTHNVRVMMPTLPSDHASLRALYNTTYLDYLTNMQKLLVQKGRIDALLKSGDLDGSGSVTDSDGDVELLMPEELETLSANHKRLHAELRAIQDAYEA